MKQRNTLRFASAGLVLIAIVFAGCGGGEEQAADTSSAGETEPVAAAETEPAAAAEMPGQALDTPGPGEFTGPDTLWSYSGMLGEPVAKFGEGPFWTETTLAAANRGTTGKPTRVVGEVVDVSCYLQLGKRGEAHIPCGTNCVANGAPVGVVDADNELYIVMAEEHDPRRYGNVALKEALLPFMAKTVEVTGMLTERDGVKTLYVMGYTVGNNPNQPKGE